MGFAGIAAERREKRQHVLNAAQIRCRERILAQMAQHPAIVLMCDTISNIRPECFSFSLPLLQFQKRFLATSANKAFVINRPVRFLPLLRSGVGDLAKPDTKNGQDFRLAQSAQAISSSLFNLNTSQMSLIRS